MIDTPLSRWPLPPTALLLTVLLMAAANAARAGAPPTTEPHYPVTLTDLAGREVTVTTAPQRIVLQESNDLLAMTLLESGSPVARVVGWQNTLKGSEPSLWTVLAERWPEIDAVPEVTFSTGGDIDSEAILSLTPDLVVARLPARGAIEAGSLDTLLASLDIPLIYLDTEYAPLENVPNSVRLLGRALDRTAAAEAYLEDYRRRLTALQARTRALPPSRVFVEVRAGEAGDGCCKTQNAVAWGRMIDSLGAENVAGERLGALPGGTVSLEALIGDPPDRYLMTGTQRVRQQAGSVPLGYRASPAAIARKLDALMNRPGFAALTTGPRRCIAALNHQFYNSVFNVIGLEYLAQAIWPEALAELDPAADYTALLAEHTSIPTDAPFVFAAERCVPDGDPGRVDG